MTFAINTSIESLDRIEREARAAAERGESMHDACRWPWESTAGHAFKRAYVMHAASMQALGIAPSTQPTTPKATA